MTLFTDSHCHLDRLDLSATDGDFSRFYQESLQPGLDQMLCVSIDLESYPAMMEMVQDFDRIHTSVGVHPNDFDRHDPQVSELVDLYRQYPSNVAIGETGLDYFRSSGDMQWQQQRFRNHIRAARELGRPLIIHTRDAREDTIRILREEKADQVGGVMHCFTETWEMAEQAMEMGFYISFSGIVTFNSAEDLRDTARKMPLERILIETDSPYLAPVPHRGKPNYPYYVEKVAQKIADLREMNIDQVAELTTQNFNNLFIN
jgi:TatD DNase family protein